MLSALWLNSPEFLTVEFAHTYTHTHPPLDCFLLSSHPWGLGCDSCAGEGEGLGETALQRTRDKEAREDLSSAHQAFKCRLTPGFTQPQ